jgi:hypothetical protein
MEKLAAGYRDDHYLGPSAAVGLHFLRLVGLDWIDLSVSEWGAFSWGAQFAVKTRQLSVMRHAVLGNLIAYAKGYKAYGYCIEQSWLHLCGMPLLASPADSPNLDPS